MDKVNVRTVNITNDLGSFNELLPFINKVFNKKFTRLMPKIYTEDMYLPHHHIVREDGRIIASVASLPTKIILPNAQLIGRGIGMVSVSKKCRGRRLMDTLMAHAVDCAKAEGVDYMFLSGNRKRYERYGFQPCCTAMKFHMIKENVKHSDKVSGYEFIRIDAGSPYLAKMEEIYNAQPVRYERLHFYKTLINWNAKKIFGIMKSGEIVGHMVVRNFAVADINVIGVPCRDVALAYFEQQHSLPFLNINVYPNRLDMMASLAEVCQYHSCETEGCMVKIVDYKTIIAKLLSAETAKITTSFVLEIEDNCKLSITAHGGKYEVSDTTATADIVLPKAIATTVLVSPQLAAAYGLPFYLKVFVPGADNV